MAARAPTYFFMHVMKTGGSTFVQHIQANFPPDAVYPAPEPGHERRRAYYMIDDLRRISPERRRSIRVYTGHFPFVAHELVGADITLAILREPVDRTLSVLRHHRRGETRLRGATLEEVYDDGWIFPLYVHNYQAKLFAMTANDKLESHLDVIDVDGPRLDTALAGLERVHVLGLYERYAEFLETMREQHGWITHNVPDLQVSPDRDEVPASLRDRIASDNAADVVLYERAREIYGARRRPTTPTPL
jgi:hypothetical protein